MATTPDSGQELWTFGDADCVDAPDPALPTLLAGAGACQKIEASVTEPVLGALRDIDPDGQPSATANGDDLDGTDDEDGVNFTSDFTIAGTGAMDITLNASGVLNVWIDWQGNDDWNDAADRVIENLTMAAGTQSFSIPVADAGVDYIVDQDTESVVLGGSPAARNGTSPYTYVWVVTPGTEGVDYNLSSTTVSNPVFTAYVENTFTATLTVIDAALLTDGDSAQIEVRFPDQWDIVDLFLGGTASYGVGILTYEPNQECNPEALMAEGIDSLFRGGMPCPVPIKRFLRLSDICCPDRIPDPVEP